MKKALLISSILLVGLSVPTTLVFACAGQFYICNDEDEFRDQFGENCDCGDQVTVIDLCGGDGQPHPVGGPCV